MLYFQGNRPYGTECHTGGLFGQNASELALCSSQPPVAQLVEQLPFKEKVVGSFPTGRTMSTFKERCVALRKKDYTLAQIVQATKRPKTSVFFHIKDIPLSSAKQNQIGRASGRRIAAEAHARKGKSLKSFSKFSAWDTHTVHAVAHFLFDGEISRAGCMYNNRSLVLVAQVQASVAHFYTFAPKQYLDVSTGVARISYFNVALAAYLKGKSDELLKKILGKPRELQRIFLKAFFDDEGCIDYKPKRCVRRVRGYQKDQRILALIEKLLLNFGIQSKVVFPNEVVVTGKENLIRFEKEVGFTQGIRINGARTNSVWKKDMKKSALLHAAVLSFKS